MNEFFYQSRGKEKVRELREEGMKSQAYNRSKAPGFVLRGLPKLILTIVGILGVLQLFLR